MTNITTDDNPFNKVVAPPSSVAELLGAGATHGELCLRFPNEDLRAPIIADNLADDVILQEAITKSRLEGWWPEAQKAGKWAFEEEKNGRVVGVNEDEEENLEGGAVQAVSVAGGEQDVDMVDS
jgi:nuclear pore complex protein Nup133